MWYMQYNNDVLVKYLASHNLWAFCLNIKTLINSSQIGNTCIAACLPVQRPGNSNNSQKDINKLAYDVKMWVSLLVVLLDRTIVMHKRNCRI